MEFLIPTATYLTVNLIALACFIAYQLYKTLHD